MASGRHYKRRSQLRQSRQDPQGFAWSNIFQFRWRWRWALLLLLCVPLGYHVVSLDRQVRAQFEGKRWALPARVYARPLELYPGKEVDAARFASELEALGYHASAKPAEAGEYRRKDQDFYLVTRSFAFWDSTEPSRSLRVRFNADRVAQVADLENRRTVPLLRMDPRPIGKIYPSHNEDRILVQLQEVPPVLIQSLLAMEDRNFYQHNGVSLRSLARAMVENMRAGEWVQGGSTITQQLVKNYFLSPERTLSRKFNEAIMALLLEWHYDKDQILEAYLNEVYYGQDGRHSIHGIGMGSWFYFNRPVQQLKLPDLALLTGLIRAASHYNPRKNPERALARRALVLKLMYEQSVITWEQYEEAVAAPLNVTDEPPESSSPYPTFLDLVRTQLRQDYREEDLHSEGLQIFTTLDPFMQRQAELAVSRTLPRLEKENRLRGLESAMVVTGTENGEVMALVGGRNLRYDGFNRALNARRSIGSLVKPAVYLAALEDSRRYSLASLLDDTAFKWQDGKNGKVWEPKNYDGREHGKVSLLRSLSQSYNLATVHLGFEVGLEKVKQTLQKLGIEREFRAYPSMLLGGVSLTPLEITQMYQTIASGGFRVPVRSIREVLNHQGQPLNRYALAIDQRFDPAPVFLLNYAMQEVLRTGTGRRTAKDLLPADVLLAGKTGTSNDMRDSWFAGFGRDLLAVSWLGRDDNKGIRLGGGDGAMRVWAEFMRTAKPQSLNLIAPSGVAWQNYGGTRMPFIVNAGKSTAVTRFNWEAGDDDVNASAWSR